MGWHSGKTHAMFCYRYIKDTAVILRDKCDGDIPDTIEGLISLPGVGPKMVRSRNSHSNHCLLSDMIFLTGIFGTAMCMEAVRERFCA